MKRREFVKGISGLGLGLLSGCGGSGELSALAPLDPGGGGVDAGSGPVFDTDPMKQAVLAGVDRFRSSLPAGMTMRDQARQMLGFLQEQGLQVGLVSQDTGVTARFPDQDEFLVLFQPVHQGDPDAPQDIPDVLDPLWADQANPEPVEVLDPLGEGGGQSPRLALSSSDRAVVVDMFPGFNQLGNFLAEGFSGATVDSGKAASFLQNSGFRVTHLRSAGPRELRERPFSDASIDVLVFFTHGGTGFGLPIPDGPVAKGRYVLSTSQTINLLFDKALDPLLDEDLKQRRVLKVSLPTLLDSKSSWFYAITPEFIKAYWRFPALSWIFSGACYSSADPSFRDALFAVGMTRFMGWTNFTLNTRAHLACRYLLDRMGGLNLLSPPSPAQRPFDLDEVFRRMGDLTLAGKKEDLTLSHAVEGSEVIDARLQLFNSPETESFFLGLMPSIRTVDVGRQLGQPQVRLNTFGSLESEQLEMLSSESSLTIASNQSGSVVCPLQSLESGAIRARLKNRLSNRKSLNRLRVPVTFSQRFDLQSLAGQDGGAGQVVYRFTLDILLAIVSFRIEPEGVVEQRLTAVLTELTSGQLVSASGTQQDGNRSYELSLNNPQPIDLFFNFGPPTSTQPDLTFGAGLDLRDAIERMVLGLNLGARVNNALQYTVRDQNNAVVDQQILESRCDTSGMRVEGTRSVPLPLPLAPGFSLSSANFTDVFGLGRRLSHPAVDLGGPPPNADPRA